MRSIWTLPVDQITAADLDEFLKQNVPEGQQLDYKKAVDNKSLPKAIASFANTVGGLIVFGVKTDGANRPILPPCGVPAADWSADQITQICVDSINPPIIPNLGPPLENPYVPGTVLAVLRVDQSVAMPHAINKSTTVPVRVKDISKRIDLADIERIASMLKCRDRHEQLRIESFNRSIARLEQATPDGHRSFPIVWYSLSPVFPWRPLTDISKCESFICDFETYRAPRGAIARHNEYANVGTQNMLKQITSISIEHTGAFFRGDVMCLANRNSMYLDLAEIFADAKKFFWHSQHFLQRDDVLHPGLVRIAIGFENVAGQPIWYDRGPSQKMPDKAFSTEVTVTYESFSELDFNAQRPPKELASLMRDVGHGFGLRLQVEP